MVPSSPERTAAHVFVSGLVEPELNAGDRHHLERVLRVRVGNLITVCDGAGSLVTCRLTSGGGLQPVSEPSFEPSPSPPVTVAFSLSKGQRPELIVQKLTEMGVDRIVAFVAERSVPRWSDGPDRHLDRLRRVAREAAMQSRQNRLPVVEALESFAAAAAIPGSALSERGGERPSLDHACLMVGPEGGWSPAEMSTDIAKVTLGPHVMRTETAAWAAGFILTALRGGVVSSR